MKKLLLLICWLTGHLAVAQVQVTNFENVLSKSPNQVEKLDTINGKLLFFISRPEISGSNLWVTDGTPENTRLMKDTAGVSPEWSEGALKQYGYLYFKSEFVYRTKGDTLERVINNIYAMEGFRSFNGKILLFYRSNKNINGEYVVTSQFQWLNADNTRTIWEENVMDYKFIGSTLHYIRFNYQTRLHELCKLDKDGVLTKNIITTPNASPVQRFEYLYNNGIEYYFFDCEKGRKMLSKPENTKEDLQFTDWGGNSFMPFIVKDSAQNAYFLKHFGSLSVYSLSKDNLVSKKWEVPITSIFLDNTDIYGNSIRYRHFLVADNKLVFNSTSGSEGINGYFLNLFDLKTGANKKSKDLIEHFRETYYDLKISVLDSNTYVLDNTVGKKYTYSFLKDTLTNIESYPFEYAKIKDSLLTINNHTLVLSGSIYALKDGIKTPLLPTRDYYPYEPSNSFIYRIVGDRILYWKYNPLREEMQLWASQGQKNDARLLMQAKEHFNYSGGEIIEQNGKLYFYTHNAKNGISVYTTDGTQQGTKRIFEGSLASFKSVYWVKANKKQIVFCFNNTGDGQASVVIVEDEKSYQLNFPILNYFEIVLSENKTFVTITNNLAEDLYQIELRGLKLIDKSIHNLYFYKERVFYQKNISQEDNPLATYTLDDSGNPVKFLTENSAGLSIYGNVLIYSQNTGEQSKFTALDLVSNQIIVRQTRNYTSNFGWYLNGTILISNVTKLSYIRNNKYTEYEIGFRAENGIAEFNKGVLLIGTKDLAYYDLETGNASRILTQQSFVSGHIYNNIGKEREFLLIELKDEKGNISWAYWSVIGKKLTYLKDNVYYFTKVSPVGGISYAIKENRYSYWHYKNGVLTEKYIIPNLDERSVFVENGNFYATIPNDSTGYELYQLSENALLAYPEIIKGSEGIELRSLFHYNNELFVYGFTFTYGMQVWKMSSPKDVTNTDGIINNTEIIAEQMIVFPNPAQDWLYIKAEKPLPYKLINTRGQLLLSGNLNPQQGIDIRQLPQGVYLVQLFDDGRVFVRKVVKE